MYEGGDRWLEVASVEAASCWSSSKTPSLKKATIRSPLNLTQITPNTTMTALQDGATQDQRFPVNDANVNEAGAAPGTPSPTKVRSGRR